MRASQILAVTAVTLLATTSGFVSASDAAAAAAKGKTPASTTDAHELFVQKVPFKYGNLTGMMVITIDPDSLKEVSEEDSAANDPSQVYDFTQPDDSASETEDRALFGNSFLEKLQQLSKSYRDVAQLVIRPKRATTCTSSAQDAAREPDTETSIRSTTLGLHLYGLGVSVETVAQLYGLGVTVARAS
ncbi:hypothetical protein PHYSODRAFT_324118 [Phytophthora sojae]|uniref:RxLR effector protein n=1 Tax=Phytophthora sojae (strain P6497) TaxID=1094619 RepID=G4YR78_PHYSP|nr:hypothetical protein PHYSODRAFT_324118 [Phytophthora sojae]EGZ22812.1 hypothetical protein PHYSODRAFT_324118 [Phytophthora sojae]|eukprot:XP_009518100.1 hypothetical protein PHYSODRAFT_324118 [Phytophthora sojae]